MNKYTRVLSIAGSDSGGCAGIQADIKTISALGCFATTAITSLTAQNTRGVQSILPIDSHFVSMQIESVLMDIGSDVIKIGLLHNKDVIEAVSMVLKKYPQIPIVLDPVMVATSGDLLLELAAIAAMKTNLFPHCLLVTPNIHEAQVLCGKSLRTVDEIKLACHEISQMGAKNVLIKGGDIKGVTARDILYSSDTATFEIFDSEKIDTKNTHGTGCSFSSAIASYLALGNTLVKSVHMAKEYIQGAITEGASYHIGGGHGPVHHFWNNKR